MNVSNGIISFSGRIKKSAYIPLFLIMLIVNIFSGALVKTPGLSGLPRTIIAVIFLFSLISIISLIVRRFRDTKTSVWWIIPTCLFMFTLYIVGIICCFRDSKWEWQYAIFICSENCKLLLVFIVGIIWRKITFVI